MWPSSEANVRIGEDSFEGVNLFLLKDECVDFLIGEDVILNSESIVPNLKGDDLPLGEKLPGVASGSCVSTDW